MNTLQIVLTVQTGIGWNFAIIRDGRALPAEDPQDFPSAARALQAAMLQLQAASSASKEGSQ